MSSQVVRIEKYLKSDLHNIGKEIERAKGVEQRNADINIEQTPLNTILVSSGGGFTRKFKQILKELNCSFTDRKNQIAFEGMIITSDKAFFESLGWVKGEPAPPAVVGFFDRAYSWALLEVGYNGTDKNILGAQVHYDETTPHLQLYYVPVVDNWKEKVYQKNTDGTIERNDRGSPVQAKDSDGKFLFRIVSNPDNPRVSRDRFWELKGGKNSFRQMQDRFYAQFNKEYGYLLDRGEVGSDRKHKTKNQYEAAKLAAENERLRKEAASLNELLKRQQQALIDSMEPFPVKRQLPEEYQPQKEPLGAEGCVDYDHRAQRKANKELERWRRAKTKLETEIENEYEKGNCGLEGE